MEAGEHDRLAVAALAEAVRARDAAAIEDLLGRLGPGRAGCVASSLPPEDRERFSLLSPIHLRGACELLSSADRARIAAEVQARRVAGMSALVWRWFT